MNEDISKEWNEEASKDNEDISVEDLDAQMEAYVKAKDDYDAKKKCSNEADKVAKEEKRKLFNLLARAGKKSWDIEGVGRCTRTETYQVATPKELEDKKLMLGYFRTLGADAYAGFVSVNSRTLNSYVKEQVKADPSFQMPGCELATVAENISLTRSKK